MLSANPPSVHHYSIEVCAQLAPLCRVCALAPLCRVCALEPPISHPRNGFSDNHFWGGEILLLIPSSKDCGPMTFGRGHAREMCTPDPIHMLGKCSVSKVMRYLEFEMQFDKTVYRPRIFRGNL